MGYVAALLMLLCQGLTAWLAVAQAAVDGDAQAYPFDPRLFRGGGTNPALLARLNQTQHLAAGTHLLDVTLNQQFVARMHVNLAEQENGQTQPCFQPDQWQSLGLTLPESEQSADCLNLLQTIPGSHAQVHADTLKLDLQIPQIFLRKTPRGYVDPAHLDAGINAGFVNYLANASYARQRGAGFTQHQQSTWLALNGGLNLGLWQFRHQANFSHTNGTRAHWNWMQTYVQRPLLSWGSVLTVGQRSTEGNLLSGMSYTGFSLRTDDRMLPDSQRGYAPVVRGVAQSNARVSIYQNGVQIYQITVAPGPFEITDLYPTSASGDLDVEVLEADGTTHRNTVPFSAVPQSLRPGHWRSQLVFGRTRGQGQNSLFADGVVQHGLSNAVTVHSGLRLARHYQAFLAGASYGGRYGTVGLDATWSHAQVPHHVMRSGWMLRASYSYHFLRTGTNFTLANYHYSTAGYQDLADVLAMRDLNSAQAWRSFTHQQRHRMDIQLSQSLGQLGQIFVSGFTQNYYDDSARATQYQVGYTTTYAQGIGVNVSLMRQHVNAAVSGVARDESLLMLLLSIPLDVVFGQHAPMLSTTATHSASTGLQLQTSVNGMVDDTLNYSLSASHDHRQGRNAWNGSVQKRFATLTAGVGVAQSADHQQVSFNAQGALAVHAGGVTLGAYVGDTFGIIEAPGAVGATLLNHPGTVVNARGYALVPALTPYRYNRVSLDPGTMPASVELVDGEQRSAPYAGAVVKLSFNTRKGYALLIRTTTPDGEPVPFGAEVRDAAGVAVGIAGQGGRIYLRSESLQGQLTVHWGETGDAQCTVMYQADESAQDQPLRRLEGVCHPAITHAPDISGPVMNARGYVLVPVVQ